MPNIDITNAFGIKTVILVRNLYDVFASLFDAARRSNLDKTQHAGEGIMMNSTAAGLDDEALMNLIIHSRLSWYMNFYVSWSYAPTLGQPADATAITAAMGTVRGEGQHRLSKGVAGRGKAMTSQRQLDILDRTGRDYARFYPWLNLPTIGLTA